MTIRGDAGKLLLHIYKCKIEGNEMLNSNQLLTETGWNEVRLNSAMQYLIESGFVKGNILKGKRLKETGFTEFQAAIISDITPSGINIVEKQPEFKQIFGFTVNLGVLQINWGAQESQMYYMEKLLQNLLKTT